MKHKLLTLLAACALCAGCNTRTATSPAPSRLAFDFNSATPWSSAVAQTTGKTTATVWQAPVGSYDTAGSAQQSPALLLSVDSTAATSAPWTAALRSGPLPVAVGEPDLAKLTLAFDLSASSAGPVFVTVTSLDARGRATGSLQGPVYPAAPDFIHRHVLDLHTLKPVGPGKFSPLDPSLELTFTLTSDLWSAAKHELRLDNVSYAGPAFYVSPAGSDSADGRTAASAFATPQAAINAAQPGDIILLGEGTYRGLQNPATTANNSGFASTANFLRPGTPAAWIVLKNYPGQRPVLTGNAWNIVNFKAGSKEEPDTTTRLAYIEVRGLHVRGESDIIATKFPEAMGKREGRTNSNGIAVDGRFMRLVPHHIRIADCLVEYVPGQGIGSLEGDWISIENNLSRFNCWTTVFATSGFSVMGASNFDAAVNVYKNLIRSNTAYRNETKLKWEKINKVSDGNGIILDVNRHTTARPNGVFLGRTLIINNLSYDNGGSGIHSVTADRLDIVNNTAYLNSASPALQYPQIQCHGGKDVRIINNILVAPVADLAAGEKAEPVNRHFADKDDGAIYSHNIYFGGNKPPHLGEGDRIADPLFVNPARDPAVADFRLRPGSPAIDSGITFPIGATDLTGPPRFRGSSIDRGAYESQPAR